MNNNFYPRKISEMDNDESRLSLLLFNKSKHLVDNLTAAAESHAMDIERKPAWIDEDDEDFRASIIPDSKSNSAYSEKLKQKYESLMGTPNWAKLSRKTNVENEDDQILRTVGHLRTGKSTNLPKDFLEIKRFPKINSETGNEGPLITCTEFHPKMSVALVAGQSGVVSLFSIGGDVNNKLHNFRLKHWKIHTARFTPDGSQAFISSKLKHYYCIYDLVKATPMLVQLPQIVRRPLIFEMSSDGKYIATAIGYDEVYLMSAASRELLRSLKHNNKVKSVTFSSNNDQLYCYGEQGDVTVWDLSTFRAVKKFYDQGCVRASCITTSSCGRLLATGSGEGIVNIYEISNINCPVPVPLKVISNLSTRISKISFNSTSEMLAMSSCRHPNAVKLVHIPSYHVFANFPQQSSNLYQVETVSFSPNSGFMALGNNKGCAYLYRLKYYKNY